MTAHLTMLQFIASRDHKLMRKVNQWPAPRWIRWWAMAATRAGDGWLWYLTGVLVLICGGDTRISAVLAAGWAALSGICSFILIKKVSGRTRPCAIQPHCWAHLLPPDRFSFPSGHTITAFAVAVTISSFYPSFWIPLLFCAVSVAISRILLGMHFLSDVLVGAILGTGLALTSYAVFS